MLVFFWATWHEPSKKAFPKLQELYAKYQSRGLAIAALSVDDEAGSVAEAAASWGGRFPVGWDAEHTAARAWTVGSMPTTYLVDRGGVVRSVAKGWHDREETALEAAILELLDAP